MSFLFWWIALVGTFVLFKTLPETGQIFEELETELIKN